MYMEKKAFVIGVMDFGECNISANQFSAEYQAHKVYLGRNITLPQSVTVSLEFFFDTEEKLREFFVFWEERTLSGAKPFYVKLPLFGVTKHYLVLLDGAITHKEAPYRTISGKFTLYTNMTLDENIPPTLSDKALSVNMDSTNNYIFMQAVDVGDVVTYDIATPPTHGTITDVGGGAYYYTPTNGYSGADSFVVRATDGVGVSTEATATINVINWKLEEEFKLVLDDNGHLIIVYVNPDAIDTLVKQAVDELSTGVINRDGEFEIDISQTQHIESIEKTADDEWLITPK